MKTPLSKTPEETGRRPPYVPWATFVGLIQRLAATGAVPPVIDNSVMSNLAGIVRTQLRSEMKFLGLIDEKNATLPPLKQLVAAHGTDKRPKLRLIRGGRRA